MKFFDNRIMTAACSLEDAVRKGQEAKAKKPESLDEILARLDAKNKQVKTAASSAPAKVAQAEAKAEVKTETKPAEPPKAGASPAVKVEVTGDLSRAKTANIENIPEDKRHPPFGKKKDKKKDDDDDEKDSKEKEEGCMAQSSKQIRLAKSLDFRAWTAEDVAKAWRQHGSIEACVKNVNGKTSDPKSYCGLLMAAHDVAEETMRKQAAQAARQEKTAEKTPEEKGVWKKLAKLTDKERAMLDKYYRKLYGDGYVDALLADY
jgi:hypothetical protein